MMNNPKHFPGATESVALPTNYILHLTAFFERIALDERIGPGHISLYMSLFQQWNLHRFQNPISVSRTRMMKASKIHAKSTYHKIIKELYEFGYVIYEPSYDPFRGSKVYLLNFKTSPCQTDPLKQAEACTGTDSNQDHLSTATNLYKDSKRSFDEHLPVQSLAPYLNNLNNTKHKTIADFKKKDSDPCTKLLADGQPRKVPSRDDVQNFFIQEKGSLLDAQRFHNYYQSNGWTVGGGRAPMKDWKAAARNWMLNALKQIPSAKIHFHATIDKNYHEPL